MRKALLSMAVAAMAAATQANATVTVNIIQTGTIVTATGTGTLDLTGMTRSAASGYAMPGIQPDHAALFAGAAAPAQLAIWSGFLATPAGFGSGSAMTAPLLTGGSLFGVTNDLAGAPALVLLDGFASGGSVRFLEAWVDQTFASLGVTTGSYSYVLPNDKIVFNIAAAVPEPASWGMMILGMGMVGHALRRRRQDAVAAA